MRSTFKSNSLLRMKVAFLFLLCVQLVVSFTVTKGNSKQVSSSSIKPIQIPIALSSRSSNYVHSSTLKLLMTNKGDNDADYSGDSLVFVNDYVGNSL